MRTNLHFLALLVASLFIEGCSEDVIQQVNPATPGDEIVFGASATYENGSVTTRTAYGDKGEGYQIINWVEGDMIRIACAQAAQAKEADYKVSSITSGSTTGDKESAAATLTKQSTSGLQWSTADSHEFFAVYPSPAHFGENPGTDQPQTTLANGTLTGVLPIVQSGTLKTKTTDGVDYDYVIEPDMDCAYMAAHATYATATEGGGGVTLHFKPIVTAIEIELKAGEIASGINSIALQQVRLYSASGKDLCGSFSASLSNLNNDANNVTANELTVTGNNAEGTVHSYVTMGLTAHNITMTSSQSCVFTFFILPTVEFDNDNTDLKLEVMYTASNTTQTKTCTLGKEVKALKKYFFSNVTLPNITEVTASNWFSQLEEDILVSQISIPGAGNAASSGYTGSNAAYYKEQTLTLTELWNLGVRCFELVSDRDQSGSSLSSQYLMCNNASVGITYGDALTTLTNLLKASPNECLIIISSYQPTGNRDIQDYMNDFYTTYGGLTSINGVEITQLKINSTVEDIRGKIAFIGRISQEGEDATTTLTNVPSWFTYIEGWGSLKDKWNRRFGDAYYPGYNLTNNMGTRENLEDRLWYATGSNNYTYTPDPSGYPESNPNFEYSISNGGTAWVQDWMRIGNNLGNQQVGTYSYTSGWGRNQTTYTYSLYINWGDNYSEKYNDVIATFEKAKDEQTRLYINSLCGFYVSTSFDNSFVPYLAGSGMSVDSRSYDIYSGLDATNWSGGTGGDFETYNTKINNDVYTYVLTQSNNNTTGPMGIVMMDYVGTGTGGTNLPSLILQNNYKFPLKTGSSSSSTTETTQYNATYSNGGNVIGDN